MATGADARLGLLIALGLSAYVLMPLATDFGLSTRPTATYEFFLGETPRNGLHLLTFFNPELFGTPLDGTFVEGWGGTSPSSAA